MNKYKTFKELKEELGDKFEEYMYKANIELLNKLDKIKLNIEQNVIRMKNGKLLVELDVNEINELLEEIE